MSQPSDSIPQGRRDPGSSKPRRRRDLGFAGSLGVLLGGMFLVGSSLVAITGIDRPPSGDEAHFVESIRIFGEGLSWDLLLHYNELNTPLPFLIYAGWGELFGFSLPSLRVLSYIETIVMLVLLHRASFEVLRDEWRALGVSLFLFLNPYTLYLGIFVHTDHTAILFLALALLGTMWRSPLWVAIGLGGAMLSRQYLAFAVAGLMGYELLRWWFSGDRHALRVLGAAALSMLPVGALFVYWGGLSPVNERMAERASRFLLFHPTSFVLYVALLAIYLFPLLLLRWRAYFARGSAWIGCLALVWLYPLFPVQPSPGAIESHNYQVGLFHRAVVWVYDAPWLEHLVFFIGWALGLCVLARIVADTAQRLTEGRVNRVLLLDLCILAFLASMPWSYLHWEKYFLPLLPIVCWRVLLTRRRGTNAHTKKMSTHASTGQASAANSDPAANRV